MGCCDSNNLLNMNYLRLAKNDLCTLLNIIKSLALFDTWTSGAVTLVIAINDTLTTMSGQPYFEIINGNVSTPGTLIINIKQTFTGANCQFNTYTILTGSCVVTQLGALPTSQSTDSITTDQLSLICCLTGQIKGLIGSIDDRLKSC